MSNCVTQVPVQEHIRWGAGLPVQPAVHPAGEGAGALPEPAVPADHQPAPQLPGEGYGGPLRPLPAHCRQGGTYLRWGGWGGNVVGKWQLAVASLHYT